MGSNEEFDLGNWCEYFPATEIDRLHAENPRNDSEDKYNRWFVCGPKSVAMNTHSRAALWPDLDPASGVATDVFAWAIGESDSRAATKIGGMPYLPRAIPWPTTEEGKAKEFVAQLNLSDSNDHLPSLPGDLLLIFCEACDSYDRYVKQRKKLNKPIKKERPEAEGPEKYGWQDNEWEFLFVDTAALGPETLITQDEIPDVRSFLRPLHGQRFRTSDHPDLDEAHREKAKSENPEVFACPPGCWWGTKIGGMPMWEQEHSFTPWGQEYGQLGGPVFIGQLNSDRSRMNAPFPYVGREAPFDDPFTAFYYYSLVIADVGTLYLFWDGEKVLYEIQGG